MGNIRRILKIRLGFSFFIIMLVIIGLGLGFEPQTLETILMVGWILAIFAYIFFLYKFKQIPK